MSKNICKFSEFISLNRLTVSNFVHETNKNVYSKESVLAQNRAILISTGRGEIHFSGKVCPYTSGNLIFGFKGETMKCVSQADSEYMYLDFDGLRCEELFHRLNINHYSRCFQNFESVVPLWFESLARAKKETIDLVSESMLLYALSKIISKPDKNNCILEQIFELTDKSFTDSKLSIKYISKELSYNSKYLSHLFKNKVGMGYNEYLRNMRIKFAISLFDSGLDSIKNVAALSGYNDALYFSSVFKKVVGMTPTQYLNKKDC